MPDDTPTHHSTGKPRGTSGVAALVGSALVGGLRTAEQLAQWLGPERLSAAADEAGRAYALASSNAHKLDRATEHLRRSYPGYSEQRVRSIAVASYSHIVQIAAETLCTPSVISQEHGLSKHFTLSPEAASIVPRLKDSDEPFILVTSHCGNWEWAGACMGLLGAKIHALYRPIDLAPVDRWLRSSREQTGLKLLDKFSAMYRVDPILESGEAVSFTADQNAGERGLFVPFYGRLASSYKSVGILALRHNVPIVCGFAPRQLPSSETDTGGRSRYRLEITDVIEPEEWTGQPDRLFYITARYRRAIETMVRSAPEQYLWMHRAWKTRPPHERAGKPFPPRLLDKLRALPWMTDEELTRILDNSALDTAALAAD